MAVKVIVPSESYNDTYCGVEFVKGVGIFEDEAEAKRISEMLGYKVEKIEDKKPAPKTKAKAQPKTKQSTAKAQPKAESEDEADKK